MALGCDPCNCTGMLDTETYRVNVIRLLCALKDKPLASSAVTMIDTLEDDSQVQFIRNYTKDAAGNITGYEDTTLNGEAYTVQGTVSFY